VSTLQVHLLPTQQVIHIQPLAPAKPTFGEVCNGCGVCCLAEPCPLGVLLSRSRIGPCKALVWADGQQQYRCGAIDSGSPSTGHIAGGFVWLRNRVVGRWIAAGNGCDCDLDAKPSSTISDPNQEI
jgi:hypothetical protein